MSACFLLIFYMSLLFLLQKLKTLTGCLNWLTEIDELDVLDNLLALILCCIRFVGWKDCLHFVMLALTFNMRTVTACRI